MFNTSAVGEPALAVAQIQAIPDALGPIAPAVLGAAQAASSSPCRPGTGRSMSRTSPSGP